MSQLSCCPQNLFKNQIFYSLCFLVACSWGLGPRVIQLKNLCSGLLLCGGLRRSAPIR